MRDDTAVGGSGERRTSTGRGGGRPGVLRRLAVGLGSLVIVYVLLELAVLAIYRPSPAAPTAAEARAASAAAVADTLDTDDLRAGRERAGLGFQDPNMCLHPYLGYVFLPKDERAGGGHPKIAISEDGFLDAAPLVRKRAAGKLLVGVMGGSVAGQLGTWHAEHLREALAARAPFADVALEFVWLGMPGYHQPQQLLQLIYLLAQGGELDLLINLDGFNEIAVPAVLNAPQGAHPLFPMNWSMVAVDAPDANLRRHVGAIAYLKEERRRRAAAFGEKLWSYSPVAKLVRQVDDRKLARAIAAHGWQLRSVQPDSIPWFVRGPARDHLETDALVDECARVWERSSRQMDAICRANGIRYLHILQPNQYDPGSKPISGEEDGQAFDPESPYKPVVEAGYPLLRDAGERLSASGIDFHDLSRVFEGVGATLYVDSCCHFNGEGNRIMADAIAEAAAAAFAREEAAG